MKKPWQQRDDEPDLWYGRFHDFYLVVGTERSLEGAYRAFWERSRSGGETGSRRRAGKMPGSWRDAQARYAWTDRARAYDREQQAEERRKLAVDLYEAKKRAAQKHQAIIGAGLNWVMRQIAEAQKDGKVVPMTVAIPLATQLIRINREELGAPIHVEVTHRGQGDDDDGPTYRDAAEAAAAEDQARFLITPEFMAAVEREQARYETKVYEDEPAPEDPDATPAPEAPPAG